MTTSGTATFDLNIAEIAEEAFERAGLELRSGYDLRTARRSINLMMSEWGNRGINLWTVNSGTVTLVQDTATYNLPADTIDIIEYVIRTGTGTSQTDYVIDRISVSTYAAVPNKTTTGRPTQVYVDRQAPVPTVTFWPIPPDNTFTFFYYRLRRLEDTGRDATNTMDVPHRFLPALVSGLAYYVAMKKPQSADRIQLLKSVYDEQFQLAAEEDRDRASARFVPWQGFNV